MSEGLQKLESHLCRLGITQTYRGDPYQQGLDWVYFDCYFDEIAVRQYFKLGTAIKYVEWDGRVAGQEAGFYEPASGYGIMGNHPIYGQARGNRKITGAE
ncbi:hypothetical protein [Hymenobacter baengnokdamensis]|uniref:hypothetical protein n=1 Tax=Hymenobacter baengnokdamensis TaxID=2615203 RepID=UPI001248A63B|nr:hypothetical protein [Hymenobacter baengnokdamensis]